MPSLEDISVAIAARIAEARSEITSLEAARDALSRDGAAPRKTRGSRRGRRIAKETRAESRNPAQAPKPRPAVERAFATAAPAQPDGNATSHAAAPRERTRGRRQAKSRTGRTTEVLAAGKLEAILRDAPDGLSAVALAKAANARERQVRELLTDRQSNGQVRRIGTGRGTRWRMITDDERIAERAAELEQRRSRTP
ncbi:MAG TPA: hypothetical protein VHX62_01410 [Solirubrobacteraceae bacterium]|jgi:hypothetical protein|nr:hypothetical protein [Solirubrobacteraceae bacterium]